MAWLPGWTKRIKLTIDSSKVDSALSDFPIAINISASSGISSTDISSVFDELASDANRKKIAVTASDGTTECYIEIENWDDANEKACLHVKVPSVASGADTDLYLYFDSGHADNTSYIGDTNSTAAEAVWDSDFTGVWHMAQDPSGGSGCILDSTSYGNDGTPAGTMLTEDLVDGQIGKALDFDGTDDEIQIGTAFDPYDANDEVTLEVVFNPPNITTDNYVAAKGDDTVSNSYGLGYYLDYSYTMSNLDGPVYWADENYGLTAGNWFYTAGTVKDTAIANFLGTAKVVETGEDLNAGGSYQFRIGSSGRSTQYTASKISEVRASQSVRSDAWLKATYNTLKDFLLTFSSNVELNLPAFEMLNTISVVPQIQPSVPVLSVTNSLDTDIFVGVPVAIPAFQVTNSMSATMQQKIYSPAFAQSNVMQANIQIGFNAPALIVSNSIETPGIFFGRIIDVDTFQVTGSISASIMIGLQPSVFSVSNTLLADIQVGLFSQVFELSNSIAEVSIVQFTTEHADVYYLFTLTGSADSTTDIEIPISSFQGRLRSDDPSYLSVVIPGTDYSDAIAARSNGELVIEMAYKLEGEYIQRQEIARVELEDIRIDRGGRNQSVTLAGHKTESFSAKAVTITQSPTYYSLSGGKLKYRFPTANMNLNPGDTVTIGTDVFVADLISYTIGVATQQMEVSEA